MTPKWNKNNYTMQMLIRKGKLIKKFFDKHAGSIGIPNGNAIDEEYLEEEGYTSSED